MELFKNMADFTAAADSGYLIDVMQKYKQAKFIYQCHKSNILQFLTTEPQSSEDIAEKAGVISERLVVVLDALTSIGLVEKENDKYSLSAISEAYLFCESPFYIGDLIELNMSDEEKCGGEMVNSWLHGNSVSREHDPQTTFSQSFVRAMAQGVLIDNSVRKTAELLCAHPCFDTAKNLLDVGGGHGLFAIAIKKLKPNISATVFDLPQNEAVAKEYGVRCGEEVAFFPGNFYIDELPPNQDVVLCFDILHPVAVSQKESVFAKAYRALNEGGHLFYKLWFLNEERTAPSRASLMAVKCKIGNGNSHVITLNEAKEMLLGQGFGIEDILSLGDGESQIIVAVKK